ncbi:DUF2142 domain-containing protein [Arthrobacter sp. zg-Y238]|uniref:DUF2142 domain-containing protein n=1 Tax=Arthrobacter sp. zg-Y238 TaxID=2964614 RepID=UPI00210732B4|nr:DUF2142 domain-containing protein [Arthrobacter sp. zg-Y238]
MAITDVRRTPITKLQNRWSFRGFAAAFGLFFALGSIWSFASPVSSYPDELAHVIKAAAVVNGQWHGQDSGGQGEEAVVDVPAYLQDYPKPPCFAFTPKVTADCTPEIGTATNDVQLTTSAGNYNPLYYSIVGLPSLVLAGDTAWYAMRLISVALTSLFAAASVSSILSLRRFRTTLAAFAVSCTPMVLYLTGGLNPQSLEIAATTAVFTATLAVMERSRNRENIRPYLVLLTVSAVVLANTRAVSLVWLALAVIAAVLLGGASNLKMLLADRGVRLAGYICAAGSAVGLLWLLTAQTFQSLTGSGEQISKGQAFLTMLDRTFDYATAYIGMFGWLDTPAPNGVYAFWGFLMVGLAVAAACVRPASRLAGPALLLAAIVLLPPVMQSAVIGDVGYIWQGRYILPLVVPFLLACGYALRDVELSRTPFFARLRALLFWLAAGAQVYAFVYVLRRYTVGLARDANWLPMLQGPLWQPPAGWITWAVAYAAALAVAVVLLLRTLRAQSSGHPQDPEAANKDKESETLPCS